MKSRKAGILVLALLVVAGTLQAQRGRIYSKAVYYPSNNQRYSQVPGSYISLNFGGNPYYYSAGQFYRPYGNVYRAAYAPFGIHVNVLPRNYHPIILGGDPYYYSNGNFYRERERDRDYEVVEAPVGAEIPSLPRDAKVIVIDGAKYYELNGTYFKESIRNGELWYRVMGKHGVLNTARPTVYRENTQNNNGNYDNNRTYSPSTRSYPNNTNNNTGNSNRNEANRDRSRDYSNTGISRNTVPDKQEAVEEADNTPAPVAKTHPIPAAPEVIITEAPKTESKPEPSRAAEAEKTTAANTTSTIGSAGYDLNRKDIPRGKITKDDLIKKEVPKTETPATAPLVENSKALAEDETEEADPATLIDKNDLPDNNPTQRVNGKPTIGRIYTSLPNNYRPIMVNGKKYFVTPDNVYYEEIRSGRTVKYKVVGR